MHTAGVLAIGEFSRLTHLSVRTLRRYHEAGPARARRRGRRHRLPLLQRRPDPDRPGHPPAARARRPAGRRAAHPALSRPRRPRRPGRRPPAAAGGPSWTGPGPRWRRCAGCCSPDPAPLDVELRAVPATTVAAVEDDVAHDEVLAWYAGAMAELDAVVGEPTGVPGGLYDNELFDGRPRARARLPCRRPSRRAAGRVHPVTLPAVELAVTTHVGEHDDIDVTYGELGAWVVGQRAGGGRPGARDLPRRPAGHQRPGRLAHRDRLAGLPGRGSRQIRLIQYADTRLTGRRSRSPRACAPWVATSSTWCSRREDRRPVPRQAPALSRRLRADAGRVAVRRRPADDRDGDRAQPRRRRRRAGDAQRRACWTRSPTRRSRPSWASSTSRSTSPPREIARRRPAPTSSRTSGPA